MTEVEEQLKLLEEKKELLKTLQKELYENRSKRDETNVKVKMLSMQIREKRSLLANNLREMNELKEKKKEIINKVKEIKSKERELIFRKNELKILKRENKKRLKSLLSLVKSRKSEEELKEELKKLEWIYQTTPMSLEEEKEYVRKIDKLMFALQIIEKCKSIRTELNKITEEIEEINLKLNHLRKERVKLSEELTKIRNIMSEKFKEVKLLKEEISKLIYQRNSLKEEADNYHKNYVKLLLKIGEVKEEIERLELLVRAFRIAKSLKERKKKLKARAEEIYERYKRGEKISWDEFKLLLEFGYIKST